MLEKNMELVLVKEKEQLCNESNMINGYKDQKASEKIMEGEDGSRTVDCLRARLLAERVASKTAKEDAEHMERRVVELEMQLKIEVESRKKAEKKLKFAAKKLNSLTLPTVLNRQNSRSSARSSSTCFSCPQDPEEQRSKFRTEVVDSDSTVSENFTLKNSTTVVADSAHEQPRNGESSNSEGTHDSRNHENLVQQEEGIQNNTALRELNTENFRKFPEVENKIRRQERIEYAENQLALIPTRTWPDSKVSATQLDNNIHDVLVALRHAKEQLRSSIGRRDTIFSQHFRLYGI